MSLRDVNGVHSTSSRSSEPISNTKLCDKQLKIEELEVKHRLIMTSFNIDDQGHQDLLRELWVSLFPEDPEILPVSEKWKLIGFQVKLKFNSLMQRINHQHQIFAAWDC